VAGVARDVAAALGRVHGAEHCYGDLHPGNVLRFFTEAPTAGWRLADLDSVCKLQTELTVRASLGLGFGLGLGLRLGLGLGLGLGLRLRLRLRLGSGPGESTRRLLTPEPNRAHPAATRIHSRLSSCWC